MATTKDEIRRWLKHGMESHATHMIVVCDTYDYEDYPSYVKGGEDANDAVKRMSATPMAKIMEVYDLSLPLEPQLAEYRAWHLPPAAPVVEQPVAQGEA
jgi:hypothetical protein